VIEFLVDRFQAKINEKKENCDSFALTNAVYYGHFEAFEKLVQLGADVFFIDDLGQGLLMFAAQGGNIQIIRHLLNNFDFSIKSAFNAETRDRNWLTALHHASALENIGAIEVLVREFSLDLSRAEDSNQAIPISSKVVNFKPFNQHIEPQKISKNYIKLIAKMLYTHRYDFQIVQFFFQTQDVNILSLKKPCLKIIGKRHGHQDAQDTGTLTLFSDYLLNRLPDSPQGSDILDEIFCKMSDKGYVRKEHMPLIIKFLDKQNPSLTQKGIDAAMINLPSYIDCLPTEQQTLLINCILGRLPSKEAVQRASYSFVSRQNSEISQMFEKYLESSNSKT